MTSQQDKDIETIKRVAGTTASVPTPYEGVEEELARHRPQSAYGHQPHPYQPNTYGPSEADKVLCAYCKCLPSHGNHVDIQLSATEEEPYTMHRGDIVELPAEYNAVEPPHYRRGPQVRGNIGSAVTMGRGAWEYTIQCIDVMRAMRDPRLATAFRYQWRVAFGGKRPEDGVSQRDKDVEDIKKAIWYLQDYLDHAGDE